MPVGAGKYDMHLLRLMQHLKAPAACLVVFGGSKGHGASVKIHYPKDAPPSDVADAHRALAKSLRTIADAMDVDADAIEAELGRPH